MGAVHQALYPAVSVQQELSNMAEEKEKASFPWTDGHYKVTGAFYRTIVVEGELGVMKHSSMGDTPMHFKYGDFGEADPKICEITGQSSYNLQIVANIGGRNWTELGVITEEGAKLTTKNMMGIAEFESVTEEEAAAWEDDGDPIEAPPGPYKIQPEKKGKFLWFSGPPGHGKSTSAQLLGRNHGYVYYEADCFYSCKNPYIPLDAPDPSLAQVNQKPLKGEGAQERRDANDKIMKEMAKIYTGDYDKEVLEESYGLMCEDIQSERSRIGGDWAIACCIMFKDMRDFIR